MTIHWGHPVPGWLIFSVLVLVLVCVNIYPPGTRPLTPYNTQSVTGIPYESPLNDTLSHYRYKQIEDSLNYIKIKEDYFTSVNYGSELYFASLGIARYGTKDKKENFLVIKGYSLDDFVTVENKKNGTLLNYPVWDKVSGDTRDGHLQRRTIEVKYKEGKEKADNGKDEGSVYIPIKSGVSNFLMVLFYVLMVLVALTFIGVVFFIPVRFLYQLAKGRAFTEENIGYLYITGWTLVGFSFLVSFLPVIAHFTMRSQIPSELHFSYYAALLSSWKLLVAGLGTLLLAKAFLQGLDLKEEQALTI